MNLSDHPLLASDEAEDTQDGTAEAMVFRAGYLIVLASKLSAGCEERRMLLRSARSLAFAAGYFGSKEGRAAVARGMAAGR